MKTLLERAKGSPLDIRSARLDRADILALLSPHSQQFRSLDLVKNRWSDVQRFSEAVSGPLPLFRTLGINIVAPDMLGPAMMFPPPPSFSLFSGAVNLKEFIFHSNGELFFNCFTFPSLTTFELSMISEGEDFPASELLDFLEATPTLETVHIRIKAEVDDPPENVIVLPNVKVFSVNQNVPGYTIAAHMSCPSARSTSLVLEEDVEQWASQDAFPTSVFSWNAIGPQYMARQIDEIVLAITSPGDDILSCSISSLSPGPAVLILGYKMTAEDDGHIEDRLSLGEKHSEVFSLALETVRKHPLLSSIKRLHIRDRHLSLAPHQLSQIANQAMQLLKSLGPLEELVFEVDDLRPFLSPFFAVQEEIQGSMQPDAFPSIKGLTIAERFEEPLSEECVDAIVGFAKSQHTRGIPFERVVLVMIYPPVGIAERLGPWVGTVHFCEAIIEDRDLV